MGKMQKKIFSNVCIILLDTIAASVGAMLYSHGEGYALLGGITSKQPKWTKGV